MGKGYSRTIYLHEKEYAKLKKQAKNENETINGMIRKCINKYINENEQNP